MLVLIADKFEQSGREGLEAVGCDYEYQPDAKEVQAFYRVNRYPAP